MRLFEFAGPDPIVTRLVAISDQLKNDIDSGEISMDMTTDQLLQYLAQYDIVVDKTDLYNMVKKPPLKNVISNIQGDNVVFKGEETPDKGSSKDDSKSVVAKMANQAANKKQ